MLRSDDQADGRARICGSHWPGKVGPSRALKFPVRPYALPGPELKQRDVLIEHVSRAFVGEIEREGMAPTATVSWLPTQESPWSGANSRFT